MRRRVNQTYSKMTHIREQQYDAVALTEMAKVVKQQSNSIEDTSQRYDRQVSTAARAAARAHGTTDNSWSTVRLQYTKEYRQPVI
jgi:hypothetical protein